MGDCFSHVSKTLLSHTLYKLDSRSKAINLVLYSYLFIYLFIYLSMYVFIYLPVVESSKVSEWKEKLPKLVLLFVKKKEWDMKYDLGPVYVEKNWDHYMFL